MCMCVYVCICMCMCTYVYIYQYSVYPCLCWCVGVWYTSIHIYIYIHYTDRYTHKHIQRKFSRGHSQKSHKCRTPRWLYRCCIETTKRTPKQIEQVQFTIVLVCRTLLSIVVLGGAIVVATKVNPQKPQIGTNSHNATNIHQHLIRWWLYPFKS